MLGYWLGSKQSSGSSGLAGEAPSYSYPGIKDWSPRVGAWAVSLGMGVPTLEMGALQHSPQHHQGADKALETADPSGNDRCHLAHSLGRFAALLPDALPPSFIRRPVSCRDRTGVCSPKGRAPPRAPRAWRRPCCRAHFCSIRLAMKCVQRFLSGTEAATA